MRKNLGLVILAIIILIVALIGIFYYNNYNAPQINENSTKIAIYNTGATWAEIILTTNTTTKNGTNITLWIDTYTKPNGNVTIDLSQLLGYGNEPLPAGTTFRIQSWKGLFNKTSGGVGTLNITFQGWSNTRYPTVNDKYTNVTFSPLNISTLPQNITDSIAYIATTPEDIARLQSIEKADEQPLYEEEVITVNEDRTVTITITRVPELCRAIASIV